MGDLGIVGDRHRRRQPDAVVGAQGGSLGPHPVAVDLDVDPLGHEVVLDVCVLLADHVEMTLQHHRGGALVTSACRDRDHHRTGVIRADFEATIGRPAADVLADLLLVSRWAGDLADLVEVLP